MNIHFEAKQYSRALMELRNVWAKWQQMLPADLQYAYSAPPYQVHFFSATIQSSWKKGITLATINLLQGVSRSRTGRGRRQTKDWLLFLLVQLAIPLQILSASIAAAYTVFFPYQNFCNFTQVFIETILFTIVACAALSLPYTLGKIWLIKLNAAPPLTD